MKDDTFDKLLTKLEADLRVTHIMVQELDFCTKSDDPFEILKKMDEKNYDILPIKDGNEFIRYIERNLLVEKKEILPASKEIIPEQVVNIDEQLIKIIDLFCSSKFFFVKNANNLMGIITYADLNKIPVRILLFIQISKLENLLLQLIKDFYLGYSWMHVLTCSRRKKITNLYKEKRKSNIDISLDHCLSLGDMLEIIECDNILSSHLGYSSKSCCKKEISGLENLRNDVMHPSNSIINTYDGVKRLSKRLNKLQKFTECIESNLDKKRQYLVEVYGSLLYSEQRKEYGNFKEVGKVKRTGWKLSFDKYSENTWKEAVLNFYETKNLDDIFYTIVFEVDAKVFEYLLKREMGKNANKWELGKPIPETSYRPVEMSSCFGKTMMFVIPDKGRKLTPTTKDTKYVNIVKCGIEENFKNEMREKNLKALDKAIKESN